MDQAAAIEELARRVDEGLKSGTLSHEGLVRAQRILSRARKQSKRSGRFYDMYPDTGPLRRELYAKHLEHFRMGRVARERCVMGGNRALPTDAMVPTPWGMRRFGGLVPGDFLIGSDGRPTRIEAVWPQGEREIWRVSFNDGSEVECDLEHLWTVRRRTAGKGTHPGTRPGPWQVQSLGDIVEGGFRPSWEVPPRPVVEYAPVGELPVDPYLLGVLLGDGSISGSPESRVQLTSADPEIADYCRGEAARFGVEVKEYGRSGRAVRYSFSGAAGRGRTANPLIRALVGLGVAGVRTADKFVPAVYMVASPEARLSLLRGLMDTDGTCGERGKASFSSVSPHLAHQACALARSLGMNAAVRVKRGRWKGAEHLSWLVKVWRGGENPFRLPRKADAWERGAPAKGGPRKLVIVGAEPVRVSDSMCVTIAAADDLFLTGPFIPTHNTGKTEMGAYEMACHLRGEYPDWWEGRVFREPVDAWACGKKLVTVRDIVQDKLFGRVAKDADNKNTIRGPGMVPLDWIKPGTVSWKTGLVGAIDNIGISYRDSKEEYSLLGFRAYEQGRGTFEGTAKFVIWLDEECPIDVYGECLIRTGTVGGIIYLTFTPLDGMTETVVQFLDETLRPPNLDVDEMEGLMG